MAKVSPAPIQDKVTDQAGKATIAWTLFFNSLYTGDTGTDWTPTFVNLTSVGTPTITGRYFKIGQKLAYFSIVVTPATNTSSTAGTTYVSNPPFTFLGNSINFAVAGAGGTVSGINDATTNRIYVPAWSLITTPVTILGIGEIR